MAIVRPFCCVRPAPEVAARVAALPYDVYNRQEAKVEVEREPMSFLHIDRAETWFPDTVDTYAPCVYEKAREVLYREIEEGIFLKEETPCYYFYELTRGDHCQTGIVACSSVDDYLDGVVKKHEKTHPHKEEDRICHVDVTNAQTGPIFLAYRARPALRRLESKAKGEEPLYDFTAPDGVRHRVFRISRPEEIELVTRELSLAGSTYIADGHHRAASAVKVAQLRREQHPGYNGEEEFNFFLSVLFPDEELEILPYNRVVRDLNGLTAEEFLEKVEESFEIVRRWEKKEERDGGHDGETAACGAGEEKGPAALLSGDGRRPGRKGEVCLLLDDVWYTLRARESILSEDPVRGLDVSLVQDHILSPILGIHDPRTDKRVEFVGGIRGVEELERRTRTDMRLAFSMYPTAMEELFRVADAGRLMPPKSTWFEPKPRSGLFIHLLG